MDKNAYRVAQAGLNQQPCVFEKTLLARNAQCELALPHALAEREAVSCSSPVACTNCTTFLGLLRERAAFSLKLGTAAHPLPHAVVMKLQSGGMEGLAEALQIKDPGKKDIHRLIAAAQQHWGSLLDLPWPEIVKAVAAWRGRRRHTSGLLRK
jgi:hypothetical protein